MADHLEIAVGDGVERLRREAAVLQATRHPGVVELLGFTDEGGVAELRTVEVDGPPLAAADNLRADEVAGLASAIATTLADLHDLGLVHGAITSSHVLLGSAGPVLCGFSAAGPPGPTRQPADDVAALCRVVLELVDHGPVADVARQRETSTARELAAAFRACIATATLPGRAAVGADPLRELLGRGAAQRSRRPSRRLLVALAVIVAVGATVALTTRRAPARVTTAPSAPRSTTTVSTMTTTTVPPAPAATLVWPPTSGPAPTFVLDGHRYTAGQPGDVALAGPFGCDGTGGTAAVLRPSNGQVFVFHEVATADQEVTSAEVATVIGGRALRAEDADDDGCTDLVVERSNGEPVPVRSTS